jgi:hypothetical protein
MATCAGAARGQDAVKPTPIVAAFIMSWEMQNDACQRGDQHACRFRDAELLSIESQGWCLSDGKTWQPAPCKSATPADANQAVIFVNKVLTDSCTDSITEACKIRDEAVSVEHFEHLEEFLMAFTLETDRRLRDRMAITTLVPIPNQRRLQSTKSET